MSLLAKNTPSRSEMTKVQQQVKVNGVSMTALRREVQEVRVKQLEQQKQLQDQEQKLLEQTQVIGEQNARLAELEHKLRELMDTGAGVAPRSGGKPGGSAAVASTSAVAASSSSSSSSLAGGLLVSGVATGAVASNGPAPAASSLGQEGAVQGSLKRSRKGADLPRHSKRLRSKK